MSERPIPISATTTVESGEERKIAGLPRGTSGSVGSGASVASLSERFVSGGTEGGGEEKDGDQMERVGAGSATGSRPVSEGEGETKSE
jgi:hypothetical protein